MSADQAPEVTPTTAPAVSRFLRTAGWLPVPRGREGLHVTAGRSVTVTADWESSRVSREQSTETERVLADAGYDVTRVSNTIVHVEGKWTP